MIRFIAFSIFVAISSALATPITFAGEPLLPALESRVDLKPGLDLIPISSLERFGITVLQSSLSGQLRLKRGGLTLEFVLLRGWLAQNEALTYLEQQATVALAISAAERASAAERGVLDFLNVALTIAPDSTTAIAALRTLGQRRR